MESDPVVFLDLDDTVFQTAQKIPHDAKSVPVTRKKDGSPGSFMTAKQWRFFQWLSRNALVIPVTGRSIEQLERVCLPFSSWRIACHGAVILNADGSVDDAWRKNVHKLLGPLQRKLHDIKRLCQRFFGSSPSVRIQIVEDMEDGGMGIYVNLKNIHPDSQEEEDFTAVLDMLYLKKYEEQFHFQTTKNNISILPRIISKGIAVKKLIVDMGIGDTPISGFGDSLSDLSFLSECDWWGTPKKSSISTFLEPAYEPRSYLYLLRHLFLR